MRKDNQITGDKKLMLKVIFVVVYNQEIDTSYTAERRKQQESPWFM